MRVFTKQSHIIGGTSGTSNWRFSVIRLRWTYRNVLGRPCQATHAQLRCGHGRVPATGTGPRAAPATATLAVLGQTSYDSTRWGAPWQYSTPSMKSASRTWLAGIGKQGSRITQVCTGAAMLAEPEQRKSKQSFCVRQERSTLTSRGGLPSGQSLHDSFILHAGCGQRLAATACSYRPAFRPCSSKHKHRQDCTLLHV